MGTPKRLLLFSFVVSFASFLSSLATSPVPPIEAYDEPDWLDDVYRGFDSLHTDRSDYSWPTDASTILSSGFAEFRGTHFHAGIDISTRGRRGYSVFASRDGYVSRILVSPYGYGKMLQVRHRDGFVTTYAHLQRFSDAIDGYVRALQVQNERYSLDCLITEEIFPVKKGELVAYTGDTGTGPPHLHFEIRDERMNPVNPLLFPLFAGAIADSYAPEFHQISFTPIDHRSTVRGIPQPLLRDAGHKGNNGYAVPAITHLSGSVGVNVKASDRVNSSAHRNAPYVLELYLDSIPLFSSRLARFRASETDQIALHFDWPMIHSGEGRFQKLYVEPGNRLPLYERQRERGGILQTSDWTEGHHELLIVARDINGNTSTLQTTVVFDRPPWFDLRRVDILVPSRPSDLELITIGRKLPLARQWNLTSFPVSRLASAEEGFVLPVDPARDGLLRISATNSNGTPSHPVFFVSAGTRASNTSLAIKKEFLRDYLFVSVSSHLPFTLRPSLWVIQENENLLVDLNATDERTYFGTVPLSSVSAGLVRLEARGDVNGASVESFDEFSVFPVSPRGGSIIAGDGEFMIQFPEQGVYQTLFCRIEKTDEGYTVLPKDVLLKRGATVRCLIPSAVPRETAGLFFSDESETRLLGSPDADRPGELSGRVSRLLGDFAILSDSIPPGISRPSVRYSGGNLRVVFGLRDNRSGIHPDRIRITVDGRLLIGEYDPERKSVSFEGTRVLEAGSHELVVEASDRLGNMASVGRTFRVGNP